MQERTSEEDRAFLAGFQARLTVDIEGLVRTLFTHGSPRSDEEIVTYATPERRMRALMDGVEERVLVTAHTHIQFDREVVGIRSINAGSVGLPYEGRPGAYWALLGPDVELRRTSYALEEAAAAYRATSDPLAERMVEMLEKPATREELVEHGESSSSPAESSESPRRSHARLRGKSGNRDRGETRAGVGRPHRSGPDPEVHVRLTGRDRLEGR